jgi:hypothetical protein
MSAVGEDSTEKEQKTNEVFHQDFTISKGDNKNFKIYLSDIFKKKPDISVHQNAIAIEVQSEVLSRGNSPLSHMLLPCLL